MNLNKAMIIGNLTRDPETRTTPTGQTVTNFGVATNFIWNDASGQRQTKVEYHNIVAWRRLAEICAQYLKKGNKVYIEGRLQTREWTTTDGQKRQRTEIIADNMIMLDTKGSRPAEATPAPTPVAAATAAPVEEPPIITEETPTHEGTGPTSPSNPTGSEEVRVEDIPF